MSENQFAPSGVAASTADAYVYADEFVWAMEQKIPGIFGANASPPTFVSLDNEPEPFSTPRLTVLDLQSNLPGTIVRAQGRVDGAK